MLLYAGGQTSRPSGRVRASAGTALECLAKDGSWSGFWQMTLGRQFWPRWFTLTKRAGYVRLCMSERQTRLHTVCYPLLFSLIGFCHTLSSTTMRNSPGLDTAWLFDFASLIRCPQPPALKLHFTARLYDGLYCGSQHHEPLPLAWPVAKADIAKREPR
ncbi:hypothetical protein LI328DRAFT_58537 [Trichoderma asperelloides]|nr:hypothetical protein LI328DRAFT_58537 [Trichoderma asperelloides]